MTTKFGLDLRVAIDRFVHGCGDVDREDGHARTLCAMQASEVEGVHYEGAGFLPATVACIAHNIRENRNSRGGFEPAIFRLRPRIALPIELTAR